MRSSSARALRVLSADAMIRLAFTALENALDDADTTVRLAVVETLGMIAEKAADCLLNHLHDEGIRSSISGALCSIEAEAFVRHHGVSAVSQLDSPDEEVRCAVLQIFMNHRSALTANLVAAVARRLNDSSAPVRAAAVDALGAVEEVSELEPLAGDLVSVCNDLEPYVRAKAVRALSGLGAALLPYVGGFIVVHHANHKFHSPRVLYQIIWLKHSKC